jgi:hypothetical protein
VFFYNLFHEIQDVYVAKFSVTFDSLCHNEKLLSCFDLFSGKKIEPVFRLALKSLKIVSRIEGRYGMQLHFVFKGIE